MSTAKNPTGNHFNAARHHEQAAYFHREASRHYEIGGDYAHAAHQALTAHGHALRALEYGKAAIMRYAGHERGPLASDLTRAADRVDAAATASPLSLGGTAHHAVAAEHHEAAEQHHARAAAHCSAEHYVRANHATSAALDLGKHALFHGDQAAMHHMEHYGSHAIAELV